jgi:hypothetical protein
MKKYLIRFSVRNDYEIEVQAASQLEAKAHIVTDIDIDDCEFIATNYASERIESIKQIE